MGSTADNDIAVCIFVQELNKLQHSAMMPHLSTNIVPLTEDICIHCIITDVKNLREKGVKTGN